MRTEKQKILILGANGQVGKELSRRAGNFEVNATAFTRTELDITAVSYTHLTLPTKA